MGENEVRSQLVLPPTVSPDARNIDYKDGTLRKRKGWTRVSPYLMRLGSLLAEDLTGMTHPRITAYDFSGSFRVDFLINVQTMPSGTSTIMTAKSANTGFAFQLSSTGAISFQAFDGGAVNRSSGSGVSVISLNTTHAVSGGYNATANEIFVILDGTTFTAACTGHTISTLDPWVWKPDTDGKMLMDEIRIWDAIPTSPTYDINTNRFGISSNSTNLVGYYKFDTVATAGVDSTTNANTATVFRRGINLSSEYISASYTGTLNGIHPVDYNDAYSQVLLSGRSGIALYRADVDQLEFLYPTTSVSSNRWTHDALNGITVLVNGSSDNLRYDPTNGLAVLTPSDFSATGITATDSGGGASPPSGGAGVYNYLFRWRNSATGDESAAGGPVTGTSAGNALDIATLPVSTELGVDQIRIYRTTTGGSTYYYLDDVANGTTTYSDDGSPALSSTLYDERYGKAPASDCVVNFNNMILLGNDSTVYASEIGSTGRHYAFNTIVLGNGDGDKITACMALSGVCAFFKTNGIYAVSGYAPQGLSAQKLFSGQGAIHASAVAASDEAVYYMTRTGICMLPLPLGSAAPVEITDQSHRSLFESMTDANRKQCSLAFDMRNRLLYAAFVSSSQPVTLVFNERGRFFSRHDIDAEIFSYFPMNGGTPGMYMGWRGYFCTMDSGSNAGIDVGSSSYSVSGTTTSTSSSIVDSGASFPTTGYGLAGCTASLLVGGVYSDYVIRYNTATTITMSSPPTVNSGTTYYLGRINGYWTSPQMLINGKGDGKVSLARVNTWQEAQSPAKTVVLTAEADDDNDTSTASLSTAETFTQSIIDASGHRVSVKFQNQNPNEPFDIEGFQLMIREASTR